MDRVVEQYKGKVRLVHQDFLLGRPRSLPAARAARCAGDQGQFWEYHRDLLNKPGDMSDERPQGEGGVPGPRRAAASRPASARTATTRPSRRPWRTDTPSGITGTPTFFVNGRRLVGARPIEDFQELIDAELKQPGA